MATTATQAAAEIENEKQLPRNLVNPLATPTQYRAYVNARARRQENQSLSPSGPTSNNNRKSQQHLMNKKEYRGLHPSDFATAVLRTGHTLRAPVQPVVGTAIVLFQRYILLSAASAAATVTNNDDENDDTDLIPFFPASISANESLLDDAAVTEEDAWNAAAAAACLFVAAKTHNFNGITYEPVTMLAVYNYHLGQIDQLFSSSSDSNKTAASFTVTLPELYRTEMEVLRQLCFTTGAAVRVGAGSVVLPYSFALTYLQVLKLTNQPIASSNSSSNESHESISESRLNGSNNNQTQPAQDQDSIQRLALPQLVWRLVTDSLVLGSDKALHTVHQPNTLACACIYLACAHLGVGVSGPAVAGSVSAEEWWKVFDVRSDDFKHCLTVLLCMDLL